MRGRPKSIVATFEVTDPALAIKIIKVIQSHKVVKTTKKRRPASRGK